MSTSLRTVAEHQQHVAGLLVPDGPAASGPGRPPTETVDLDAARGRVLAAPVHAPEPLPAFDNSAMDGYAVRAVDVAGATAQQPVTLPVAGDVPAGAALTDLAPGTALRIMTGAPVPRGADAVVEVEVTDGGTDVVRIDAAREAGRFVRPAGSDVSAGQQVLAEGALLGPAQVGLLAALGITRVVVRRRPRVLVVSTGSELAEDPVPGAGQIRDANGALLAAAVAEAGGVAVRRLWVADDVPAFLALLDSELAGGDVDLVLTSGGVSAGAYEVVKEALGPRGVEFVKVAMQPGMPQGSGLVGGVPVVCLPGNPVSALTSFEVFVRPALRRAHGHPVPHRPVLRVALTEPLVPLAGKRQLRRGRLDRAAGTVTPWGPAGSGFLGWFAGADALIDLPPAGAPLNVGDEVEVWDLASG
ncbi:molybdopterin molybdotransferase MoeA [Nocardioides sp. zg-536]|uniref:Molybdopterin molybdenumtransferase n=1 Tax=Nocardioides faecalis TaxID=2803858 RepID=A0A939BT77_9ACTN|nr:gephyrin-like molybdotransferase Glp [Nocardioides faecalis]MBM9460374.1 molybdopterin molybdotransferase MoeA [Nocardioides faecalis]QVI59799.1 molybdopterin molybdotransferase MoeA [Nocardioides faecalis]